MQDWDLHLGSRKAAQARHVAGSDSPQGSLERPLCEAMKERPKEQNIEDADPNCGMSSKETFRHGVKRGQQRATGSGPKLNKKEKVN